MTVISTGNVYLGTPFYNDAQKKRVKLAQEYLAENPTVVRVHFPFDYEFVGTEVSISGPYWAKYRQILIHKSTSSNAST